MFVLIVTLSQSRNYSVVVIVVTKVQPCWVCLLDGISLIRKCFSITLTSYLYDVVTTTTTSFLKKKKKKNYYGTDKRLLSVPLLLPNIPCPIWSDVGYYVVWNLGNFIIWVNCWQRKKFGNHVSSLKYPPVSFKKLN